MTLEQMPAHARLQARLLYQRARERFRLRIAWIYIGHCRFRELKQSCRFLSTRSSELGASRDFMTTVSRMGRKAPPYSCTAALPAAVPRASRDARARFFNCRCRCRARPSSRQSAARPRESAEWVGAVHLHYYLYLSYFATTNNKTQT